MVKASSERGSLLIEGVFTVMILVSGVILTLEIARRGLLSLTLYQASFIAARERTLGASELEARFGAYSLMQQAFGFIPLYSGLGHLSYDEKYVNQSGLGYLGLGGRSGGVVELHYRYPQFMTQRMGSQTKRNQEVLERCLFPF